MKGKNMTIYELMLAAIVSSETCRYIEIDGKRYNQAIDIIRAHGDREILGYSERLDHSVRINLKPIENKAPERAEPATSNWIRFDPDDRLTWPMEDEDLPGFSAPVITCTDDNCIHIGYIMHFEATAEAESTWELSNCAEDISLPLDSVIAWQPLPKPFHMEQEAEG